MLSSTLSASDALLGAPGTKYPTGDSDRGLELDRSQDYLTLTVLSDGETKITVHFYTHGNVDQIRILTAVPEPSSLVIAACARPSLRLAPSSGVEADLPERLHGFQPNHRRDSLLRSGISLRESRKNSIVE